MGNREKVKKFLCIGGQVVLKQEQRTEEERE